MEAAGWLIVVAGDCSMRRKDDARRQRPRAVCHGLRGRRRVADSALISAVYVDSSRRKVAEAATADG